MEESGRLHRTETPETALGAEVFKAGCLEVVSLKLHAVGQWSCALERFVSCIVFNKILMGQ